MNFSISIHDDRRTLGRRRQSVDCSCWPIFSPLLPMLVVATKVHLICEQVRDGEVGVANGFHLEVGGNQITRLRRCAQEQRTRSRGPNFLILSQTLYTPNSSEMASNLPRGEPAPPHPKTQKHEEAWSRCQTPHSEG